MFQKTDSQTSLLESRFLVPPAKRARLERSWAHAFNLMVLPLINEELFRACFHDINGRPNKSIRMLTSLHLLKEWNDLTDEQVLESLEFNLQWHYALGLTSNEAHTCQKTLHNYRVMLLKDERARAMFDALTTGIAALDGLGVERQRMDSTHMMSNIAVLTRLALFVETVTKFLRELKLKASGKLGAIDAGYAKRYLEREGYFADAKREQARRRLPVVARDLLALVRAFESDVEVREWESYGLMARLLEEQCEAIEHEEEEGPAGGAVPVEESPTAPAAESKGGDDEAESRSGDEETADEGGGDADDDSGNEVPRAAPPTRSEDALRLKEGKEILGNSLQSPHDPDATYGHKGKGYETQIAETCEESNPYQIITGVEVNGANESDQHAMLPMIEQLRGKGLDPKVMYADTGYGSGENIVACAEYGVDLQAPVQDPDKPQPTEHSAEPVEPSRDKALESGASTEVPQDDPQSDDAPESEQDREEQMGLESFAYNETFNKVETCPAGHAPVEQEVRDAPVPYRATFSKERCEGCPLAGRCPAHRLKSGDRVLRWRDVKAATATRQQEQQKPAFKEGYKIRSGIESTNNEFKGRHGAEKLRVRGEARVRAAVFLKAASLNVKRMVLYHTRQFNVAAGPAIAPA